MHNYQNFSFQPTFCCFFFLFFPANSENFPFFQLFFFCISFYCPPKAIQFYLKQKKRKGSSRKFSLKKRTQNKENFCSNKNSRRAKSQSLHLAFLASPDSFACLFLRQKCSSKEKNKPCCKSSIQSMTSFCFAHKKRKRMLLRKVCTLFVFK